LYYESKSKNGVGENLLNKVDILQRSLHNLKNDRDVIGSAISSKNGLVMATYLPEGIDRNSFCAMAGSLF